MGSVGRLHAAEVSPGVIVEGAQSDPLCRARYERVRAAMADHRVDVLLLARQANAYYASGARRVQIAGSGGGVPWVVVRAGENAPTVFTTDLDGLPEWIADAGRLFCWNPTRLVDEISAFGVRRIAYDVASPRFLALLEAAIPGIEWQDGEALMTAVTAIKSPEEVARIEAAVGAAEHAAEAGLRAFHATPEENRVRAATMGAAIEAGAGFLAREVGCRIAADRRRIELEVAVVRDGYQGECVTTGFAAGAPQDACAAWNRTAENVVAACRPGATAEGLRAAGGEVVIHSIGTGVERPTWPLRSGMVVVATLATAMIRGTVTAAITASGARLLSRPFVSLA